jgi:hypothetical protein
LYNDDNDDSGDLCVNEVAVVDDVDADEAVDVTE